MSIKLLTGGQLAAEILAQMEVPFRGLAVRIVSMLAAEAPEELETWKSLKSSEVARKIMMRLDPGELFGLSLRLEDLWKTVDDQQERINAFWDGLGASVLAILQMGFQAFVTAMAGQLISEIEG